MSFRGMMGKTAEEAASAKVKANTITRPSVRIMEMGDHLFSRLKAAWTCAELGSRITTETNIHCSTSVWLDIEII